MNLWAAIAILAGVAVVLVLLTQPEDLRRHRWLRIACSLPLVACASTFFLPFFIAGVGFLAFLWSDVISHYASGWFTNFVFRDISSETGLKPDFRYAHNHRRDGEPDKAIAAIECELRKDPKNFEGRLLLAGIHQDLNQPREALKQLDVIIDNSAATPHQIEVARREKDNCRQLRRHLDEQAFFKPSPSR